MAYREQGEIGAPNRGRALSNILTRIAAAFSTNSLGKVLVAVIYAATTVWMMRNFLAGDRTFFGCCDASTQSIAWLNKVAEATRHHTFALWDFSVFGGTTSAGQLQPGTFYPLTIMLGLLGAKNVAIGNAFIYMHFAIALASMHLFLRGIGLSRLAAIAGAISFTFGGYVALQADAQANIYAGLVLLPLIAHFYHCACRAERISEATVLAGTGGLAGAAQIAAGHMQPFIYSSYALGLYALVLAVRNRKAKWWQSILTLLVSQASALAFAAVPVFLSVQYLMRAYRWDQTGVTVWPHAVPLNTWISEPAALHWRDFSTLLSAHSQLSGYYATLYLTITGLAIVPLTLRRLKPLTCWLWLLVAFAVIVALGGELGALADVIYFLPLLAQTRTPARALYLYNFATAGLIGIAIDQLRYFLKSRPAVVREGLALILVLLMTYEINQFFTSEIGMTLTSHQEAHRFYFHNPALDALERLSNSGPLVDRFLDVKGSLTEAIVPPNAGDLRPLLNTFGVGLTMLRPLGDFAFTSDDKNYATSPAYDELGVRWVISDSSLEGMTLIEKGVGYYLYERPNRLSVLWTENKGGAREPMPVEKARWEDNDVKFRLKPDAAPHRVVFAQPIYPGWQAFVDERPVPLHQTDIFMAVDAPAGSRQIEFTYRPLAAFSRLDGGNIRAWRVRATASVRRRID